MDDNPFLTMPKIQRVDQAQKIPLSGFRGSIAVSEPQDFDTIRQQVLDHHAYRSTTDFEVILVKAPGA